MPKTLQVRILKRFLNDKDFDSLYSSYKAACLKRHRTRDVGPLDRKIWQDYRGGATLSELGEKHRKSRNFILYSIALMARASK